MCLVVIILLFLPVDGLDNVKISLSTEAGGILGRKYGGKLKAFYLRDNVAVNRSNNFIVISNT